MNTLWSVSLGLSVVALSVGIGCNSPTNEPGDSSSSGDSREPLVAESSHNNSIVGVWLGRASIDQNKLRAKLNSISDVARRNEIELIAQVFMSTQMGAEFAENGNLKFDLEFRAINGQIMDGASWGHWTLVKQSDGFVIIEKTENFDDGSSETELVRYDFPDNPHQFEFVYPHPDLLDCNAMIVFERQDFSQSPPSKIAEQLDITDSKGDNRRQ